MKNQNDLILIIVAFLIGAIGISVIYFTKPNAQPSKQAPTIDLSPVKTSDASITYSSSLPGGGGSSGSGGAARGGGPAAGAARGAAPGGMGMAAAGPRGPGGGGGAPGPGVPGAAGTAGLNPNAPTD